MNLFFMDENNVEILSIKSDCQPYKEGDIVEIKIEVSAYHKDQWSFENINYGCNLYKIIKLENKIRVLYTKTVKVSVTTYFICEKIEVKNE